MMRRPPLTSIIAMILFSTIAVGYFTTTRRSRKFTASCSRCPRFMEPTVQMTYDSESALEVVNAPALMQNTVTARPRYNFLLIPSMEVFETPQARWTSLVVVKSAYGNKDRRDAIRDTWASLKRYKTGRLVTVFLLGKPRPEQENALEQIQAEHKAHGDILLLDIVDVAENVPDKTLAGMQWAANHVLPSWIYSSTDDDISLHVPNFARYIEDMISKTGPYTPEQCQFYTFNLPIMCVYSYQRRDPPARDRNSKWYISKSLYPPSHWPPYCRGGWYSMPVRLAGKLYETIRWMKYLYLDDVWITGLARIKYAVALNEKKAVMTALLDAAPLSLRNDAQLGTNFNETASVVIVSHAWGNIKGRPVKVGQKLRENWKLWSLSFPANVVQNAPSCSVMESC